MDYISHENTLLESLAATSTVVRCSSSCPSASTTTFSLRLCFPHTAPGQWLNTAKWLTQVCSLKTWDFSAVQLRLKDTSLTWQKTPWNCFLLKHLFSPDSFTHQTFIVVLQFFLSIPVPLLYLLYFPNMTFMCPPKVSCIFNSILASAPWRTQHNACLLFMSHITLILLSFNLPQQAQ